METLFLRVLSLALTCSAVILPLLLLGRVLRSRYAARTLYFVWLFLAVRLLVPVRFELPTPAVAVEVPSYTVEVPVYQPPQAATQLPAEPGGNAPAPAPQAPQSRAVSVTALWAAVWAAGAASVLLWQCAAYLHCRRKLLRGAEDVALALPNRVRAVRARGAETPMMLGLVRPVLVLPHAPLDDATLEVVLRHELCHLRRRDVAYKMLMVLVSAVYWFNPLMWLMAAEAGRNVELCCDDEVLKNADRAERRRYGEVLLAASAGGRAPAFATRFGSPKNQMKERLGNLFAQKKTGAVLVCVLLLAAVAVGSLFVLRPVEDDTLYRNEKYGFTLQLPRSWQGKYTVRENTTTTNGQEAEYGIVFLQNKNGIGPPGIFALSIDNADEEITEDPGHIMFLGEGGGWVFSLMFYSGNDKNNDEFFALRSDALELTEKDFRYTGPGAAETPMPRPAVRVEMIDNNSEANLTAVRGQNFGVDFPQVDYVSQDLLIFHDYWGLAVYDFRLGEITHVLDTPSIGMNRIQGDQYTEVKVTENPMQIYIYNTPGEHTDDAAWRYDLTGGAAYAATIAEAKAAAGIKSTVEAGAFFFPEGTVDMVIGNLVYRAADGTEHRVFEDPEWLWPLEGNYTITNVFGARIHPITGEMGNHTGTDILAAENTPVRAARGGVVIDCGYDQQDGNYVKIDHGDGFATRYCHLNTLTAEVGQTVAQGQTIGNVGNTGSATGYHLHYELWENGGRRDILTKYPNLKFTYQSSSLPPSEEGGAPAGAEGV